MRNGLAVVFFAVVSFLANTSVNAAATIGASAITPSSTPAGTALVVTISSTITDPSLIAGSVNLQKLDTSGRVVATIGNLHDDGVAGDATAGDKVFSITTTVLENTPGTVRYRVSAAFQGSLVRAFSSPLSVTISGTATGITIQSPANAAYVNTPIVTVNGTVGDSAAQVVVNGVVAPLSGNSFVASVPLNEGPNTLTAVATNTNGTTSTASILVTLDTTPPHVDVYSPEANAVTTESTVNVAGLVNDIVVGTVNTIQANVTVNGIAAQVANRSFAATNLPVSLGVNLFQVTATDRAGNSATTSVSITRKAITEKTLKINRGNGQSGVIRSRLPLPMEVQLVDAAGAPIANTPVVFRVTNQDGVLSQTGAAGTGVPALAVNTSALGVASVFLNLGSRSGVGNNVVEASTTGVANTAVFIASATPAPAGLIVVDAGGNQSGVIGQQLPLPFIAIVTDAGNNRLPGIPVTFTVRKGGGNFAGKPSLVANTDSDGRVMASLTLGPDQGVNNNLVEINFTGNTGFPAVFTATGLTPGPAANTRISGVVLDNSNMPIPGVTMRLLKINQGNVGNIPQEVAPSVRTDARGQFVMQPVPVGVFKLMADGGTALRTGGWPTIEYDMITVPGQDNNVGSPIYLPELIAQNRLCVSETTGGTLTIPQAPGFSLTIIPGSATFPGGARSGCVSVTPVNMDKVPMVPGFGQQPRFVVTIQPVGTHFNPPAAIAIPNVDGLAPRAVTEMYSYDHDLASFVAIGSGTVSEDGSIIRSDPGVGVLKAGWHCGGDPNTTGSAGTCPECKKCEGSSCVALPGTPACDDKDDCTVKDKCTGGVCKGEPLEVGDIAGACVIATSTAGTYTSASNEPSKISWSAPGGTPASATGGSFSVQFGAAGNYSITAGCSAIKKSKAIDAADSCASHPAAIFDSTQAAGTPCAACFGEVNTPIRHSAEYDPCVDSSKWCFREKKFSIEFKVGVQSLGNTDVPSAASAAVTAATYCQIIRDLTPNVASDCGRPPRASYWSQSLTLIHENFHVSDFRDNYLKAKMNELENYVKLMSNCTDCKSDKTAALNTKMEVLYSEAFSAFVAGGLHECRAYGDGVAGYTALVDAIKARATANSWAACPP